MLSDPQKRNLYDEYGEEGADRDLIKVMVLAGVRVRERTVTAARCL